MSNSLEKYFQCFGDGKKLKKKLNLKQATSPICRFVFFFFPDILTSMNSNTYSYYTFRIKCSTAGHTVCLFLVVFNLIL